MTVLVSPTPSVLAGFTSPPPDNPVLHGTLTRSIARALVECAVLAYKSPAEVEKALDSDKTSRRLKHFQWFEATGRSFDSQAFACVIPGHVILAFRGTKELRDFLTDAMINKHRFTDFDGHETNDIRVHSGFQRALNALWSDKQSERQKALSTVGPPIDTFLRDLDQSDRIQRELDPQFPERQLWLTGHSLGAALATIAAARVQLTKGAPFQGRIGALVTVGSPRVLDRSGAERLEDALDRGRIFRIHRSIDPVPAVPYRGFGHVSGPKAFVSNRGALVMGVNKRRRWAERTAAFLLAVEDAVGSALPGRHRGFAKFVSDHASEDYLEAVAKYETGNRIRMRDTIGPIAVPLLKLAGVGTTGWSAAKTTGAADVAYEAVVASAGFLQRGAETLLALLF